MRNDMRHIIVDAGRYKYQHGENRLKNKDLEELPEREGMRAPHRSYHFTFGDRLSPFIRFLQKNCGRPWSEVYSEIRRNLDHRTLRGQHFLEHVESETRIYQFRRPPFYVDDDGLLRHHPYRRYKTKSKEDPNKKIIGDSTYERISGIWYETWTGIRVNEFGQQYEGQLKRQLGKKELKELRLR